MGERRITKFSKISKYHVFAAIAICSVTFYYLIVFLVLNESNHGLNTKVAKSPAKSNEKPSSEKKWYSEDSLSLDDSYSNDAIDIMIANAILKTNNLNSEARQDKMNYVRKYNTTFPGEDNSLDQENTTMFQVDNLTSNDVNNTSNMSAGNSLMHINKKHGDRKSIKSFLSDVFITRIPKNRRGNIRSCYRRAYTFINRRQKNHIIKKFILIVLDLVQLIIECFIGAIYNLSMCLFKGCSFIWHKVVGGLYYLNGLINSEPNERIQELTNLPTEQSAANISSYNQNIPNTISSTVNSNMKIFRIDEENVIEEVESFTNPILDTTEDTQIARMITLNVCTGVMLLLRQRSTCLDSIDFETLLNNFWDFYYDKRNRFMDKLGIPKSVPRHGHRSCHPSGQDQCIEFMRLDQLPENNGTVGETVVLDINRAKEPIDLCDERFKGKKIYLKLYRNTSYISVISDMIYHIVKTHEGRIIVMLLFFIAGFIMKILGLFLLPINFF